MADYVIITVRVIFTFSLALELFQMDVLSGLQENTHVTGPQEVQLQVENDMDLNRGQKGEGLGF